MWQYVQPASQPQTTCNHAGRIVWNQPPEQLRKLWVCTTKEFLHNLSETVLGKLICVLILTRVLTWLQFGVVTDSVQILTFDGHRHSKEVCSSRMNPGFNFTGQVAVWRCVGERVCWCQCCEQSAPWGWWGYAMGRHKLRCYGDQWAEIRRALTLQRLFDRASQQEHTGRSGG